MYLCELCGDPVGPNVSRIVHTVYRSTVDRISRKRRKEIAKEIPVCPACKQGIFVKQHTISHRRPTVKIGTAVDF